MKHSVNWFLLPFFIKLSKLIAGSICPIQLCPKMFFNLFRYFQKLYLIEKEVKSPDVFLVLPSNHTPYSFAKVNQKELKESFYKKNQ